MANHVEYNMMFERLTEEGLDFLEKLFENKESLYEIDMIDEVGAKWANIEDAASDREMKEFYVMGTSAWSAPWGLQEVHSELLKHSPDAIGVFTYADEMPNFVGSYILEPVIDEETGLMYSSEDGEEFEDTEIFEKFKELFAKELEEVGLSEDVTIDEFHESEDDDVMELWHSNLWEAANTLQHECIENLRQYL